MWKEEKRNMGNEAFGQIGPNIPSFHFPLVRTSHMA
jgi:hypothetical protein